MSIGAGIAFAAVVLLAGVMLLALCLLQKNKEAEPLPPEQWPTVAILLAVRNEAHNLPRCLSSIAALDYPADKLKVFIGNDSSEDETMAVAEAFCRNRAGWEVRDIQEEWRQAKGKANVLAQLAYAAGQEPEFLFTTDADIAVPPSWVKAMLSHFSAGTGLLSGITMVEGQSFFPRMQGYDWALGIGLAKAYSYLPVVGKTLSVMGNNMAVRKEAYQKVGGYESIPFSVTEDFALHRELTHVGFDSKLIFDPAVKAFTLPVRSWNSLLHQRRRWMEGALQLPWPMLVILFVQALFFPALLLLLLDAPVLGLCLWLLKVVVQRLLVRQVFVQIKEPSKLPFFGFEWYSLLMGLNLVIFYLLPVPFKWKGRAY